MTSLRSDDRGVSTTLGYVLGLGITSLLISGLLLAAGGYVDSQRQQVVRSELEVVGESLAADIEGADRLAVATEGSTVEVASPLPQRVGEDGYRIELTDGGAAQTLDGVTYHPTTLTLIANSIDVSIEVRVLTRTEIDTPTTVGGGEVVVELNGGELEVVEA